MIPEGWTPKPLDEMTLKEAVIVVTDSQICGSCSQSLCQGRRWENSSDNCSNVSSKAKEIVKQEYGTDELDELVRVFFERLEQKQEPEEDVTPSNFTPSNMLAYKDTINLMKSHGYHRCYMCGSSLERNE